MLKQMLDRRRLLVFVTCAGLAAALSFAAIAPLDEDRYGIPLALIALGAVLGGTLAVVSDTYARPEPGRGPGAPRRTMQIRRGYSNMALAFLASRVAIELVERSGAFIVLGALLVLVGLDVLLARVQRRTLAASAAPTAAPQLRARLRWVEAAGVALLVLQIAAVLVSNAYRSAPCSWADLIRRLQGCQGTLHQPASVSDLSYTPDGRLLAVGSSDGQLRLWSLPDRRLLRTLQGHTGRISSVAVAPDGGTVASVSRDNTVRLWRVSDGALLRTWPADTSAISGVAFSPDGSILAASGNSGIKLWRIADGTLLTTLEQGNTGELLQFTPDGATLVSGGSINQIQVWDVASGTRRRTLGGGIIFDAFALSPDGTLIAAGDSKGQLSLWPLLDDEPSRRWQGHADHVVALAFSPDGATLASAGDFDDARAQLWRVADSARLRTITVKVRADRLAFAPDGPTLAVATDSDVQLWRYR